VLQYTKYTKQPFSGLKIKINQNQTPGQVFTAKRKTALQRTR